ncbi:N-acetylglucosaminylphosphatidylinositol deacetylase [Nematocida sp. ERTm5]|nr:N-acetylglucosaminylphosphatidylinositol deacetylase [Nematocida sp. ERTm5]
MIQALFVVVLLRLAMNYIIHKLNNAKLPDNLRYLMIIAHPDDESMFFGPFLTDVLRKKGDISVVVCTGGEKGGKKKVRKQEMEYLCVSHGMSLFLLDYPDGRLRETDKLMNNLEIIYKSTNSTSIITFDSSGVSSHADHIACNKISVLLAKKVKTKHLYALESLGVLEKYFLPVFTLFNLIFMRKSGILVTNSLYERIKNRRRMFCHKSQLLWYRYLYIIFSSYMDFTVLEDLTE